MPGNDGTGPRGQGPMTGRGMGLCILRTDPEKPGEIAGFAGMDGRPVNVMKNEVSSFNQGFHHRSSRLALRATRDKSSYGGQDGGCFAKEVIRMPGGDGTGPGGMGPMTGRAAGHCAGYPMPGFMNLIPGCGLGFGRGQGLGFRGGRGRFGGHGAGWGGNRGAAYEPPVPYGAPAGVPYGVAPPTPPQELDALKGQSEYLENALGGVRKRIEELETETKE